MSVSKAVSTSTRVFELKVDVEHKLQALVYNILPSTTAVLSYAIMRVQKTVS